MSSDSPADMLDDLFRGDIGRFDAKLQEAMRGPAGSVLRQAHLTEQFAKRLFQGDYHAARRAMETALPELAKATPREAALTHEGMLRVKEIIERRERALKRPRGVWVVIDAFKEGWKRELEPLLDLLPAAWRLTDGEFELLLRSPPNWLNAWRNHEVELDEATMDRLRRLRRLHEAFRLVMNPLAYADAWRRPWHAESVIGGRSPWQAYEQDGDSALDVIEGYFGAQI